MLRLRSAASALSAVQFVLLGAYTGAAMNMVAALRNYTFYKNPAQPQERLGIIFFHGSRLACHGIDVARNDKFTPPWR